MRKLVTAGLLLFLVVCFSGLSFGQTTSTLTGVVRDSGGAVLPGVTVTAASPSLARGSATVISDDSGNYRVIGVQAGVYTLRAELDGFATANVTGIEVAVNTTVIQDVTLGIANITQEITVNASTIVVRKTDADLQEIIGTREIENLPLNGRNFVDLMQLSPAVAFRPSDSDQGSDVTVFGERSVTNSFLVDGLDNNDVYDRNFSEFFIQDAIQEFQVLVGGYQAEFGRAQGAVTNVITRSGGEEVHGSFFYFKRDDQLDSSNIPNQPVEGLNRVETGGTLGGPLWSDTFFFYAFQYLNEERSANFDRSIIPVSIDEGYFTPSLGGEPWDYVPMEKRHTHFFKGDHSFSDTSQIFFTINTNRAEKSLIPPALGAPPGTISLPSTSSDITMDTTSVNARHTGFLNPTTFMESSIRVSKSVYGENDKKPVGAEQLFPITSNPFVIWASNGPLVDATAREQNRFQWTENLSYIKGDHSIKIGGDLLRNDLSNEFRPRQSIIIGNSALDSMYGDLGYSISMQRGGSQIVSDNKVAEASDNLIGVYAQDSWQVRPGLTFNFGVRYDASTLFSQDSDNLSPRVGFAWDLANDGSTVVRANYGRFYDQTMLSVVSNTPSLGGIQVGSQSIQTIDRGASFYNNPLMGAYGFLQASSSRILANPLFFQDILPTSKTHSSGGCTFTGKGKPLAVYDLLGISVSNPKIPPVLNKTSIPTLTGGTHTAESAVALLNTTYGAAANAAGLPGCTNPGGDQFKYLHETGVNSLNKGEPLIFLFRQLELQIDSIQTMSNPTSTPYTDSFNIGIEQALGNDISIDVQFFARRSRDLLTRRVVNLLDVPVSASCSGNTVNKGPCERRMEYLGFLDSNAITLSLNKRFSNNYSFLANYSYTQATDNFSTLRVPPPSSEVSFLWNNRPEEDIGKSLNTPVHNFVLSGLYQLGWDTVISGVTRATSGRPFNAIGIGADSDGDNIFDNRLIGTQKGEFQTEPYLSTDFRMTKNIMLGDEAKITGMFEIFNLFNRANPYEVNRACSDTDGDGTVDAKGCQGGAFGQVIRPFPGREIQLGLKLSF